MVFKAVPRALPGRPATADGPVLVAGVTIEVAAQATPYPAGVTFDIWAVGLGMYPRAYDLSCGPDPELKTCGVYRKSDRFTYSGRPLAERIL